MLARTIALIWPILTLVSGRPKTIGPDPNQNLAKVSADVKAQLMRDHLIPRALSGVARPPRKDNDRTYINVSLDARSVDLDVVHGQFRVDGYMVMICDQNSLINFEIKRFLGGGVYKF